MRALPRLYFFATAGLWLLLQAEFLALILVLVYVGAVMTLFLFVVTMLSVHIESVSAKKASCQLPTVLFGFHFNDRWLFITAVSWC